MTHERTLLHLEHTSIRILTFYRASTLSLSKYHTFLGSCTPYISSAGRMTFSSITFLSSSARMALIAPRITMSIWLRRACSHSGESERVQLSSRLIAAFIHQMMVYLHLRPWLHAVDEPTPNRMQYQSTFEYCWGAKEEKPIGLIVVPYHQAMGGSCNSSSIWDTPSLSQRFRLWGLYLIFVAYFLYIILQQATNPNPSITPCACFPFYFLNLEFQRSLNPEIQVSPSYSLSPLLSQVCAIFVTSPSSRMWTDCHWCNICLEHIAEATEVLVY